MPEGHTIHRLAREVERRFAGDVVVVSSPQGRFAAGAALVDGRVLTAAEAYGKHLFVDLDEPGGDDDRWVHLHLGLFGKVAVGDGPPPPPRGQVRVRFVGAGGWLDVRGPTRCAVIDGAERDAVLARLGPDPLRPGARGDAAGRRVRRSRATVGALLLDQSVVAGVGNVYRAEVLFRQGVAPQRLGRSLSEPEWAAVWADLVTLLRAGMRSGRIVTTMPQDRTRVSGTARRDDAHYVYRREGLPCRRCSTEIVATVLANRRIAWCPGCQPH